MWVMTFHSDLGVDPKRFTPGAIQSQISDAKNKLRDSEDYGRLVGRPTGRRSSPGTTTSSR